MFYKDLNWTKNIYISIEISVLTLSNISMVCDRKKMEYLLLKNYIVILWLYSDWDHSISFVTWYFTTILIYEEWHICLFVHRLHHEPFAEMEALSSYGIGPALLMLGEGYSSKYLCYKKWYLFHSRPYRHFPSGAILNRRWPMYTKKKSSILQLFNFICIYSYYMWKWL